MQQFGTPQYHNAINQIEMIQHSAAHFVLNRPWRRYHHNNITLMLTELQWPTLQTLITIMLDLFYYIN